MNGIKKGGCLAKAHSLDAQVIKLVPSVERRLAGHWGGMKYLADVSSELRRNTMLQQCTFRSLSECILQAAELRLRLASVLGHAYLVPRMMGRGKGKGVWTAQFMLGYKGMIALANRSGRVSVHAVAAYKNERDQGRFEHEEGTYGRIVHRPLPPSERGDIIGMYCVVNREGYKPATEWMWEEELQEIASEQIKKSPNGPWSKFGLPMRAKTVIRRALKVVPLNDEFQAAVALDEMQEAGVEQNISLEDDERDEIEAIEAEAIDVDVMQKPLKPEAHPSGINDPALQQYADMEVRQ